jgi:protein-tyrosine phosphatase
MGFFNNLFRKKEKLLEPADISALHVDIHSHFIPGIDDGAEDLEQSLDLLRKMSELGYRKVITTPHVMSDFYRNDPKIILAGLEKVRQGIKEAGIPIEIEAAAEYYLDDQLESLIERNEVLSFGNKYLLFEMPFIAEPQNLARAVFNMQLGGYKPILAHPERYQFWHNDFQKYEDIFDKGVLLQVNINSLSGYYSPAVKKIAEQLIDKDMVSFLGTDCHRMEHLDIYQNITCRTPYFHKLLGSGKLLNSTL